MPSWKGKTRGGILGYKIFIFVLKTFGISSAYMLLRFVAAYFIVAAPGASVSNYKFFRHILHQEKWKAFISVYKSYFVFGQTLIDKVAIGSGLRSKYRYRFDGHEHLKELSETGGIIISAHLGNWDIAGYLLDTIKVKTNILMFEAEHQKIRGYLKNVITQNKVNIIPIKPDLSHVFKVHAALQKKEIICMHGDRFLEGSRVSKKTFMGKEAFFPLGPFSIASKLNAPYTIAYAVRGEKLEYLLSSTPVKKAGSDPEIMLNDYVGSLEHKLKQYPLQWFNYYDFWNENLQGAAVTKE